MDIRVSERELSPMHIWRASMVMLARPGELQGVSIFEAPALGKASDGQTPDLPYHLLVIEVANPQDLTTQARIRANLQAFIA